jgi:hypothetical protein
MLFACNGDLNLFFAIFTILIPISHEAVENCISATMLRSPVAEEPCRSWRKLCTEDLEEITSAVWFNIHTIYPSYHSECSHLFNIFPEMHG